MVHTFLTATEPIRWDRLTADRLQRDVEVAIGQSRANLDRIAARDLADVTFANTIEALELATEPLDRAWGRASHLNNVSNGEEFRAAYNGSLEPVTRFYGSIVLDGAVWERVKAFGRTGEAQRLEGIHRRLWEETEKDFLEGGADLAPEKKARLEELRTLLARATQKYAENVLDATEKWEKFVEDGRDLAGLPEPILAIMEEDARIHGRPGAYRLTLHAPIYGPAMRYLESDELRRELLAAHSSLGSLPPYDNTEWIGEILQLRREMAQLLGRQDFADFVLSRRMAGNGAAALAFVENLHRRIRRNFSRDIGQLERFRATALGQKKVEHLQPWELAFWAEKQCRALHDFDDEQLRPYLELDTVLEGLFAVVRRLYGITCREIPTTTDGDAFPDRIPIWHGSVRFFEMHGPDGRRIGSFYLDLFPREGKRSGAWMDEGFTVGHRDEGGQWVPAVGMVAANVTPPTGDQPSLLTHGEVETLYHEFGHLLHHLLGKVEYASLNGTNVAWDFVELPSQILENWTWERPCLELFARHYRSGEPLPAGLFERMTAARTYLASLAFMRQLAFAKMDLDLHRTYDGSPIDGFVDGSIAAYKVPYKTPQPNNVRHFSHLFSDPTGYAAAYYSYKWAEVLDADAFERFREEGIFNGATANDFLHTILERGNGAPAGELYRDFRGRDPRVDALLRRDGLAPGRPIRRR
jgi:oligopeptidase A